MRLYNGVSIGVPSPCPANVRRLDLGAVPMIVSMHQQGTLIDQKHFKWLQGELETRLTGIDANIRTRVGGWKPRGLETFNIGSPVQVGELLYDHIAIHRARPDAVKKTDSGRLSTGDEFLSLFKDVDPLVQMVLDWRQTKKLLTTYAYKLPAMARAQGGRLHTEFTITRTSTGRIASKNPNCFSSDTEILTPRGWVRFPELTGDDSVAQWRLEDETIEFVKPTARQVVGGQRTIRLHNQHIDLCVTKDHRCLIKNKNGGCKVVRAEDYPEFFLQLNAGDWAGGPGIVATDADIRLMVATQADGSWSGKNDALDFSFRKVRKIERFKKLLVDCGIDCQPKITNRTRFYFRSSRMLELLGREKQFGFWLLNMSRHQVDVFLSEILFWDGCWERKNSYASNKKINADVVQALYILSDKRANVRKYVNSAGSVSWQVDINVAQADNNFSHTDNIIREPESEPTIVYCVSVPSSYVVVRRNGKVMITGQCQNIPTRSDWGKEIRKGFVAQDGWVLVSLDLSQIEMVLAAFMSGDPTMMDVFLNGLDIHNKTACSIFRIDEQYITQLALEADLDEKKIASMDPIRKAEWKKFKNGVRLPCKTLGFGILYGQTPEGLQTGIAAAGGPWWELDKCEKLVADWYNVYSGVADWMQEQHQRARRYGMVWDLFGRARLIPEVRSVHRANVNAGLRACGNMPIQATAGGILKLAMAYIHREVLPLYAGVARALLTIHDELIFECRADVAAEFVEVGKTVMETVVPLLAGFGGPVDTPIKSSGDIAINWGVCK